METIGKYEKGMWILKALLVSYIVTGSCLLILSYGVYRCQFDAYFVSTMITGIYIVSTMAGGFVIGKQLKNKKILWGILLGGAYFFILCLVSYGLYGGGDPIDLQTASTVFLCVGGGAIGSMFS